MIRLGVRLTVRGGREALTRLLVIVAAVAVGVTLLLATLATLNAVHAQNDRYAWLNTGAPGAPAAPGAPGIAAGGKTSADPVWWWLTGDEFRGRQIARVDVAATGPDSPVPPGIARLPGPGEYDASPALAKLLRSVPADQLADRYPGRLVGTIGAAALPAPDSLVIIVGEPVGQLAHTPGAELVHTINAASPNQCAGPCYVGLSSKSINVILAVVTAAILFPVLIFIGTATRLSAARREQRFAALRLVGATPPQITVLSSIESTLASAAGTLLGFGLFYAVRPLLVQVPFTGARFYTGDLSLGTADVLLVGLGVPLGAAFAAWVALRRVIISPLGVARRVTPSAPRAWRLLPVLIGLAELTYFVLAGRPATVGGQILAYTAGVVITLGGLVVAGPWLTMVGARALAHRARRPATLIAARRLADNPKAGFRAISGLVVGLFVATVAYGVISTFTFYRGDTTAESAADRATLVDQLWDFSPSGGVSAPVASVPVAVQRELAGTPGVRGVLVVHAVDERADQQLQGVVSCAKLVAVPVLGRCPSGVSTATISAGLGDPALRNSASTVWPATGMSARAVSRLPVGAVLVATDGSAGALERARTVLVRGLPHLRGSVPLTIAEGQAQSDNAQRNAGYRQLADIVIITSLPIAGCTLAVSVVAGLNDRRRPFSLLRLTGAPLATLRRVVALESSVPLLLSAAVAVGTGLLTAFLFLRSQLSETLLAPGVEYYGVVVAGLLASLTIIASTMPVLARITGPEAARDD
jgi:Predicted ABC-type transport system involved in lysophospholipase L1 biosynthesis, permease component